MPSPSKCLLKAIPSLVCQVVLLSGEPGIGKSRLTAALLERLASEAARATSLLLLGGRGRGGRMQASEAIASNQ